MASTAASSSPTATLAFALGFNVHYGQVQPRVDLDVIMIAPKAPGHTVRGTFAQGGGVPMLIAPKIITEESKKAMKKALHDIQTGEYAKSFILENKAGAPTILSRRRLTAEHPTEKVGEKLREMMPWIKKNKLVDQSRN